MTKISLRALRINKNMTAEQVASKVGIHQQTLLKYEKDSTKIPMNLLIKLSELYEVEPDYIFLGSKFALKQNLV